MSTVRVNPLSIPRPKRKTVSFELSGEIEGHGLLVIKGEMRQLDAASGHISGERAAELIARYIDGTDEEDAIAIPGLEDPELSESLMSSAAVLETMVFKIEGGDPYNAEEYVAMCHNMPEHWNQLLAKASELNGGNSRSQTTGKSSVSALPTTPNLSSGQTAISAA